MLPLNPALLTAALSWCTGLVSLNQTEGMTEKKRSWLAKPRGCRLYVNALWCFMCFCVDSLNCKRHVGGCRRTVPQLTEDWWGLEQARGKIQVRDMIISSALGLINLWSHVLQMYDECVDSSILCEITCLCVQWSEVYDNCDNSLVMTGWLKETVIILPLWSNLWC